MGTSRNPAEFSRKFGGFIKDIESGDITREAVAAAAFEYKQVGVLAYRRETGSDLRLSGVGRSGAKVGVRFDDPIGKVNVVAIVRATGPAHLIDFATKPHRIPSGRRRRRGRRSVVNIPGVGWRAYAQHPGTKGRPTFHPAMRIGRVRAMRAFGTWFGKGMRRRFT